MDFTKFVDLMDTQELFFPRADNLGDPFEGSLPIRSANYRKYVIDRLVDQEKIKKEYKGAASLQKDAESALKEMAVSCWHMNDHESAAMWKLYLKSDEGIAIQSTYSNLVKVLDVSPISINIGCVNYIDYETQSINFGDAFAPYVNKRKSFEHEKELRAVIWVKGYGNLELCGPLIDGIRVKVSLNDLIERIYIAPNSPDWILGLVQSVAGKYEISKNVIRSKLDERPVY